MVGTAISKIVKKLTANAEGCIRSAIAIPTNAPPKCASCPMLSLLDLIPYIENETYKIPYNQAGIEKGSPKNPIPIPGNNVIEANMIPQTAPDAPTEL